MGEAQCDRKTEKRPLDMCKRYGSGQRDGEKRWKENKNKSYLKMSLTTCNALYANNNKTHINERASYTSRWSSKGI